MKKATENKLTVSELAQAIHAGESTRCGCGSHGSWLHAVRGTSGPNQNKVVWCGCPNCSGTALGSPIFPAELARWEKLSLAQQREEMADIAAAEAYPDYVSNGAISGRSGKDQVELRMSSVDRGTQFVMVDFYENSCEVESVN